MFDINAWLFSHAKLRLTERNVRNLQDAVQLISEIRAKIKVLETYYADWDTNGGVD
jgi:hypothetical protein